MAPKQKPNAASVPPSPPPQKYFEEVLQGIKGLDVGPKNPSSSTNDPNLPASSMKNTHPKMCDRLIQSRSTVVPRYLFRVWNHRSGGFKGLNTENAITPLAFFKNRPQPPFWHHSRATIRDSMQDHLFNRQSQPDGRAYRTFFSSWSHSLAFVISFAQADGVLDNLHISVIDTHALDDSNFIVFVPQACHIISDDIPLFDMEFLIYGTVSGPAHKAVAMQDMSKLRQLKNLPIKAALDHALKIGHAFGPKFELPIIAYLLTMAVRSETDIMSVLSQLMMEIPDDWVEALKSFSGIFVDPGNVPDTTRAIDLMRVLARFSLAKQHWTMRKQMEAMAAEVAALREKVPREHDGASLRALVSSARISQESKQLYIDLIGWTPKDLADLPRTRGAAKTAAAMAKGGKK